MKEFRIIVRCAQQPQMHAKVVRVKARLGKRKAQELADLLDGTSLAYVHQPGPHSPIGRCCICAAEVSCELTEMIDGKLNEVIDPNKEKKAETKLAHQLGIA